MEKPIKIILYIVTGIILINLLVTLLGNSNLKSIRQDLEQAKRTSDSALYQLRLAKGRLDSIQSDIVVFRAYIDRIENTVAINDAEKRLKEERSAQKKNELMEEIQRRREHMAQDTLPDIHVITKR